MTRKQIEKNILTKIEDNKKKFGDVGNSNLRLSLIDSHIIKMIDGASSLEEVKEIIRVRKEIFYNIPI